MLMDSVLSGASASSQVRTKDLNLNYSLDRYLQDQIDERIDLIRLGIPKARKSRNIQMLQKSVEALEESLTDTIGSST